MTRTISRNNGAIFAAVTLAILISASSAASQECVADADCGDGEYCKIDALSEMCQNPEPEQESACEGARSESYGRCMLIADRCETDDDCAEYYTCKKESFGMGEACATPAYPESDMPPCASRSIEYESKYGSCEPGPIDCESNSDCPSPLTCVEFPSSGACWESSDGQSGCSETTVEKHCEFEPPSCETDDDCEADSECVEVGSSTDCGETFVTTSRAATPPIDAGASQDMPIVPPCAEGDEECTNGDPEVDGGTPDIEPEPVPIMPDCETVTKKICFPKRVDCTDDDQCAPGETCTDFSEMNNSPAWWEDGETAIACMPEGLVMAFEGHATRGVTNGYDFVDESAGGMDPVATSANQAVSSGEGVDQNEGGAKVDEESDTTGTEEVPEESEASDESQTSDDGGCSIARPGGKASSSWLLLIASVLVFRSIRRRRN